MRLEISEIKRPEFGSLESVVADSFDRVWLRGHVPAAVAGTETARVVGQLREVAPDLYELVARGALLAHADGEVCRIFGRAEAALELASRAKQEVAQ